MPVVLFSGGEPLMRPDLFDLVARTVAHGMRAVISTNGTLIDRGLARRLQDLGLSYVGISLDGTETVHDKFRGEKGSFAAAMAGVRHCQEAGLKVGLRFTVSRLNYQEVPAIFDLVETCDIPRICFYHLVYAGRGSRLVEEALSHGQTRELVDLICARTRRLFEAGRHVEVLTVDNHADGPYIYLKLLQEDPRRAAEVLELLQDERRQQLRPGHRLRQLGRPGPRRPVLAALLLRQRAPAPLQRDLDRPRNPLMAKLKDKKPPRHRPLRPLPLAGRLRRQLPGAGRSLHRRPLGPGPRLLPDG